MRTLDAVYTAAITAVTVCICAGVIYHWPVIELILSMRIH